jgi:hypothetical protein
MDLEIPKYKHSHERKIQTELNAVLLNELTLKGQLFVRGIINPRQRSLYSKHNETNWEIELRKINRKIGIPTRTSKKDSRMKDGNPNRSTTLFCPSVSLFWSVGYGIIEPDIKDIKCVTSNMNSYISGCGKKKLVHENIPNDTIIDQSLNTDKKLELLLEHIKNKKSNKYFVNEILMDIREKNINFIYYIYDFNFSDAIYMQQLVKTNLDKDIPIFKYSKEMNKFI